MGREVLICGCMIAGLWGIGRQGKSNNSLVVGNWKVIGVGQSATISAFNVQRLFLGFGICVILVFGRSSGGATGTMD
jgi:hypothetical protein